MNFYTYKGFGANFWFLRSGYALPTEPKIRVLSDIV